MLDNSTSQEIVKFDGIILKMWIFGQFSEISPQDENNQQNSTVPSNVSSGSYNVPTLDNNPLVHQYDHDVPTSHMDSFSRKFYHHQGKKKWHRP